MKSFTDRLGSNNTNKLSPQEPEELDNIDIDSSNNTNKLSPQELPRLYPFAVKSSNNTNKLSPQERTYAIITEVVVQIIQINLVLKNNDTTHVKIELRSNNTNKLSPQELSALL